MLHTVSSEEAKKTVDSFAVNIQSENVRLSCAAGRVLARDVKSEENVPSFDRSTVDGFAVRAADTYGAGESMPAIFSVKKEIFMGSDADFEIAPGECAKISTGGMLPKGADAAVMVENTDLSLGDCLIYKSVSPFENVTRTGDDVKENEIVLKAGTLLSPHVIGVLAAMGKSTVSVIKRPTVGILSTGDELVDADTVPRPGQVRDVNTYMLASLCRQAGCDVNSYGVLGDDHDTIAAAVKKAEEDCDVILLSGGSSAGARDMTAQILSEQGQTLIHGIAVKPGKPTVIGTIGQKAVFGLPGHPAAAYFVFIRFVLPHLYRLGGRTLREHTEKAVLQTNISSNHGREEFVCVKLENGTATPFFSKSGVISMLSKTDGYIVIDRNSEGLAAGEEVEVHPWNGCF